MKNRKAVPIVRDGKKAITTADTMSSDGIQARIDELQKELIRKLIQQITVYDDHFTVEFKSGITIDIES